MINAMRYTRVLEESGFSKEQASTALNVVLELMNDNFASPKDIQISEQSVRSALSSSEFELRRELHEFKDEFRTNIQEIKAEIQEVRSELKAEIQEVRSELKTEIQEVRSDMILMENRVISKLTKNVVLIAGLMVTIQTIVLRL